MTWKTRLFGILTAGSVLVALAMASGLDLWDW